MRNSDKCTNDFGKQFKGTQKCLKDAKEFDKKCLSYFEFPNLPGKCQEKYDAVAIECGGTFPPIKIFQDNGKR